jgi:hypothetical protein
MEVRMTIAVASEPDLMVDDDELALLALSADPNVTVDEDAVCLWEITGDDARRSLPEWYMPSAIGGASHVGGWRRWTVLVIVLAFLVITAYGLCNTYDQFPFG